MRVTSLPPTRKSSSYDSIWAPHRLRTICRFFAGSKKRRRRVPAERQICGSRMMVACVAAIKFQWLSLLISSVKVYVAGP